MRQLTLDANVAADASESGLVCRRQSIRRHFDLGTSIRRTQENRRLTSSGTKMLLRPKVRLFEGGWRIGFPKVVLLRASRRQRMAPRRLLKLRTL